MRLKPRHTRALSGERGAVAVIFAILLVVLIGLAALAIDTGHLYVVKNELQNAADSGALAGARFLFNEDGINTGANQTAYDAATSNNSEHLAVEVNWGGGNEGDIQRGHWSFPPRTFTPNASTGQAPLSDASFEELDANTDLINAVRVRTKREDTPAASFFASLFGHDSFPVYAEATAYIGFAGSLDRWEVDQPIALCKETLLIDGEYSCSVGRFINSGNNLSGGTGGWTDFNQEGNVCAGGTNAPKVSGEICGGGNSVPLELGQNMATNGGEIQSAFSKLMDCWKGSGDSDGDGAPDTPWEITLPVVECPDNNVGPCSKLVGSVTVNVVWITGAGEDPGYTNAPVRMGDWSEPANGDNTNGQARWESFADHFNLQNYDGSPVPYGKKSIYFKPDCDVHEPKGSTGGENFGIPAEIPVLVN